MLSGLLADVTWVLGGQNIVTLKQRPGGLEMTFGGSDVVFSLKTFRTDGRAMN